MVKTIPQLGSGSLNRSGGIWSHDLKTFVRTMLPPTGHFEIQGSLLVSQFSELKDGISKIITSELLPLRALIECSAKDIDVRLYNLEVRLKTALEHSSQMAHTADIQEKNSTDSKEFAHYFAGLGTSLRIDLRYSRFTILTGFAIRFTILTGFAILTQTM